MLKFVAALLFAYVTVYVTKTPHIAEATFIAKIFGFMLSAIAAVYGFGIGLKIRNFAMPDFVVTDGGAASLIKTKLFWAIGIQLISAAVAAFITTAIFFNWFGASPETLAEHHAARVRAGQEQYAREHPEEVAADARQKSIEAKEMAQAEAQRKISEAREKILSQSSDLQLEYTSAKMSCDKELSASKDGVFDYSANKWIIKPQPDNPYGKSCGVAKALLERIRQMGVCRAPEGGDGTWAPCAELKSQ